MDIIPEITSAAGGRFSFSDLTPDEYRRLRRKGNLPAVEDDIAYRKYKDEWGNAGSWVIPALSAVVGAAGTRATGGSALSTIGGGTVGLGIGMIIQKAKRIAENRKARRRIQNSATTLSYMYR